MLWKSPQNKIVFQIPAILFALCSLLSFWDVVPPISPTIHVLLHSLTVSAYICGEKESIQCICVYCTYMYAPLVTYSRIYEHVTRIAHCKKLDTQKLSQHSFKVFSRNGLTREGNKTESLRSPTCLSTWIKESNMNPWLYIFQQFS